MRLPTRCALIFAVLFSAPFYVGAAVSERLVQPESTSYPGILKVERFGNRENRALVFIPALFCGSWQWNAQINKLSKEYNVLVVTLPGFGGRPMVAGDDLMARAAESLHELIATGHLRRPVVVGHSLGGTLAVYFAEHYPSDLTNLVTVEGGYPVAPTQPARDAAVKKSTAPYEGLPQAEVGAVARKQTLQYTITQKNDVETVEILAARSKPAAIVAWLQAALSLDLTPGLKRIAVPFTAIIPFDPDIDPYQGFKTAAQKQDDYARWVANAPDGNVVLVTPSRHFVMFDRPQRFEQALEKAISR
ncbi:MAG TPA: alpha/beta hydrolase [Candidatus Cybelea sp.]